MTLPPTNPLALLNNNFLSVSPSQREGAGGWVSKRQTRSKSTTDTLRTDESSTAPRDNRTDRAQSADPRADFAQTLNKTVKRKRADKPPHEKLAEHAASRSDRHAETAVAATKPEQADRIVTDADVTLDATQESLDSAIDTVPHQQELPEETFFAAASDPVSAAADVSDLPVAQSVEAQGAEAETVAPAAQTQTPHPAHPLHPHVQPPELAALPILELKPVPPQAQDAKTTSEQDQPTAATLPESKPQPAAVSSSQTVRSQRTAATISAPTASTTTDADPTDPALSAIDTVELQSEAISAEAQQEVAAEYASQAADTPRKSRRAEPQPTRVQDSAPAAHKAEAQSPVADQPRIQPAPASAKPSPAAADAKPAPSGDAPPAPAQPAAPVQSAPVSIEQAPIPRSDARLLSPSATHATDGPSGQLTPANAAAPGVPVAQPATTALFERLGAPSLARFDAQQAEVSPQQAQAFASQVQRGLAAAIAQNSDGGGGAVTLRLSPESLGQMKVQVHVAHGAVAAVFEVSTPRTRDLLNKSLGALRQSLSDKGLSVQEVRVSLAHPLPRPDMGHNPAALPFADANVGGWGSSGNGADQNGNAHAHDFAGAPDRADPADLPLNFALAHPDPAIGRMQYVAMPDGRLGVVALA